MVEQNIALLEYLTEDGKNIFHDWLRRLPDPETRARIRARLNRIRLGNFGDCEPVGNGVSELRLHHGPGYRVYFGQQGSALVILLCGGTKRAQTKDIKLAQAYWADFQRRSS